MSDLGVIKGAGYGGLDYDTEGEDGWSLFKYEEINDVPTDLGTISVVATYGGEGQGDDYWVVVKISNADGERYFKRCGYYQSYSGGELDGPTYEVTPVERVVTFYE